MSLGALLLAVGAILALPELPGELVIQGPVKVVLVTGKAYDVPGPVTRRGGRVIFRTEQGLLSLDARQVREIHSRTVAAPGTLAPEPPAVADKAADPPVRYTNADLPPPPAGANAELEPFKEEPAAEAPGLVVTPGLASIEDSAPEEINGHSEAWWRAQVANMRAAIVDLEKEESQTYRLLICAQHGIALNSPACNPRLLPQPNKIPVTPTDRSLAQKLRETSERLEQRRKELTDFLENAFELGVPTTWLL